MGKVLVEQGLRLSVWSLRKHGALKSSCYAVWSWGDNFRMNMELSLEGSYIRLAYKDEKYWTGEEVNLNYDHSLTTTPCNYGGKRYWFICRLSRNGWMCGRRVGVLYKPCGSVYWGCRRCFNLAYIDQNENRGGKWKALFRCLDLEMKAEKIQEKIKRKIWAGRPTRKQRRLLRIYERMDRLDNYSEELNKALANLEKK